MDKSITVRWLVYAAAVYLAYVLYQDHVMLWKLIDFMSHVGA